MRVHKIGVPKVKKTETLNKKKKGKKTSGVNCKKREKGKSRLPKKRSTKNEMIRKGRETRNTRRTT